jgi:hypothetical protein
MGVALTIHNSYLAEPFHHDTKMAHLRLDGTKSHYRAKKSRCDRNDSHSIKRLTKTSQKRDIG